MCRFFFEVAAVQYDVLRAAEDYEHEKLAQESKAAREKKELVAEKNREKRELTRMRKEETRMRAVLKKEGEKVAKKQRKVESQEAKVARKKAKAQKAKKDALFFAQRPRANRKGMEGLRAKMKGIETPKGQNERN